MYLVHACDLRDEMRLSGIVVEVSSISLGGRCCLREDSLPMGFARFRCQKMERAL